MNTADTVNLLLETTAASSCALLLVLALRRPLRAAFGAGVAYGVWALLPIALIAVLLPAATAPLALPVMAVFNTAPFTAIADPIATATSDPRLLVSVLWLLGATLLAWGLVRQQRSFRARLGRLRHREDGLQQADGIDGLPAAIGWWRPVVVLPADFETRYSVEQRALMLAHERAHIARGDLHANAAAAVLRCVFWFNPLVHYAARHFRHDQELACDARVIASHPHARRAYGEAMFHTQLTTHALPLGCHWGYSHPLKERIAMLKQPVPSSLRWIAGSVLVAALTLGAGLTTWAAQPPDGNDAAVPVPPPALPTPPAAPAPPLAAPQTALPRPPLPPAPPAPPPAPPAPPAPMVGIDLKPPVYPKVLSDHGIGGDVVLIVDVAADGSVSNAVVDRSEPAGVFDAAALEAVKQWKFKPGLKDGKPVAGRVRVPINFTPETSAVQG